MAKPGVKTNVDQSELPFKYRGKGARRLAAFSKAFIRVPKGKSAGKALIMRPWQIELLGSVFHSGKQPRLAAFCLGRGNGKSTILCVPALYELFLGEMGASVIICATDQRQAEIIFNTCVRMVELNSDLDSRCHVYKDKIVVPNRGASLQVLPAEPKRLEGLDYSLAILDEAGVIANETFEVVSLASGKREQSTVLCIGTPSIDADSVLARLRRYGLENPDDDSFVYREFSAAEFLDHEIDCLHCWQLANPALGDFLYEDGLRALLPPKTSESAFRRARLCQPVLGTGETYLDLKTWLACSEPDRVILPGAAVVIGFDGSRISDSTALVMVSIEDKPIVELVGLWQPHLEDADYRVPILAVESEIRRLADIYSVKEIACDPSGFARTMEILSDEGYPIVSHPNSRERMAPLVAAFREAVHQGELSHNGDPLLTAHVCNAVMVEWARGIGVSKQTSRSNRKIDALIAGLMAYGRAKWHHSNKPVPSTLTVMKMGR